MENITLAFITKEKGHPFKDNLFTKLKKITTNYFVITSFFTLLKSLFSILTL
ncbi:MAG: hypothetical protein H6Q16_1187 [Bacteroidetes bacterium]|nr:hypothetical protein [Bacteroidota bacterium]